jgi:protease IV
MRMTATLLALLLTAGCALISIDLTPRIKPLEERTVEGTGKTKILLTDISGFLSEEGETPTVVIGAPPPRVPLLVRFREALKKAEEDRNVKALVVRINSAGGTVTAADIMFKELEMFKRATRIPVVAVMMDVAASGGYYVALAADTIIAHPTTVTGSIGVIMVTLNAEGLLQKLGLAAAAIKSGERKDMGSPFRTLTDEERKIFQSVIDGLHGQFVSRLVEARKLPLETVKTLADGRVYTAQQALELKLIDRIGYMDDALQVARRAIGVDEARVIVYHRPLEYRATYYARSEVSPGSLDTTVAQLASVVGAGPRFLYMWWP